MAVLVWKNNPRANGTAQIVLGSESVRKVDDGFRSTCFSLRSYIAEFRCGYNWKLETICIFIFVVNLCLLLGLDLQDANSIFVQVFLIYGRVWTFVYFTQTVYYQAQFIYELLWNCSKICWYYRIGVYIFTFRVDWNYVASVWLSLKRIFGGKWVVE